MFEEFKELGLYSSKVGHVLTTNAKGTKHLLINSIGRNFMVYDTARLTKVTISEKHPAEIQYLAADKRFIYTGCENTVRIFKNKQNVERELKCDGKVFLILPCGGSHVVAVDENNSMKCWMVETGTEFSSVSFSQDSFRITSISPLISFRNKILLGSAQGKLRLWNILKHEVIYEFLVTNGVPITCIEQSTARNLVGIGTESGAVVILDIKQDKIMFKLHQEAGPICSMAFMKDMNNLLVVGTTLGHISVWDLNDQVLKDTKICHQDTAVAALTSIHGQNTFISNSGDNSIKMWVIDENSYKFSVLRERSGHYGDISKVKFYDDEKILSAGEDSTVRLYSCIKENRNKSLGKAAYGKKKKGKVHKVLPHIVDFQFEKTRESHWDGMIALHKDYLLATTWNVKNSRIGSYKFFHERFKDASLTKTLKSEPVVSSVEVTLCGNYSLIGYSSGHVDVYNMQSGLHKGEIKSATKAAHSSAVVGIGVDSMNQTVVTLGTDKMVKFWSFKLRSLMSSVKLDWVPVAGKMHRQSSMMAVVLQNFSLVVIALDTQKVVRRFKGHSGSVNDLVWSDDGLLLITASSDCYIRVWDVTLGLLVDSFSVDTPVKSLTLSPNTAILATTHVDSPSICLWSNSSLYGLDTYQPELMDYEEGVIIFEGSGVEVTERKSQLEPNLFTQSGVPSSRWVNLSNMDLIRQKNKPKEPVKKVSTAPFFLFSQGQTEDKFEVEEEGQSFAYFQLSAFAKALKSKTCEEMLAYIKELGQTGIDTGIKSLGSDHVGSDELLIKFLEFLKYVLETKANIDIAAAYINLFQRHHDKELYRSTECMTLLREVHQLQTEMRREFYNLINIALSSTDFMKSALI